MGEKHNPVPVKTSSKFRWTDRGDPDTQVHSGSSCDVKKLSSKYMPPPRP